MENSRKSSIKDKIDLKAEAHTSHTTRQINYSNRNLNQFGGNIKIENSRRREPKKSPSSSCISGDRPVVASKPKFKEEKSINSMLQTSRRPEVLSELTGVRKAGTRDRIQLFKTPQLTSQSWKSVRDRNVETMLESWTHQ